MLSFNFKKRLREFQLDVSVNLDNQTLVFIGHSGCGKTTTLQLLAGLLAPDQGVMELNGNKLVDTSTGLSLPPESRGIGYVFQDYALFPHLTVSENILYGVRHVTREEQDNRLEEMLSLFKLRQLSDALPSSLSGGQQQRVALARALVTRPQLLLLDEPLSALDVSTRGHVRLELKTLLDSLAIPCIVVTHDYEDARVLGDEIAVIDQGVIVQSGQSELISKKPANTFVAKFIGTNLVVDKKKSSSDNSYLCDMIAFDPWQARVSRERPKSLAQWEGEIKDMAHFGAFTRLHIHGDNPLMADVPIQSADYKMGEHVFVSVDESDVRRYETEIPSHIFAEMSSQDSERQTHATKNSSIQLKRRRRKIGAVIAIMAVIVLTLGVVSGVKGFFHTSQAASPVQLEILIAANATEPIGDAIQVFEKKNAEVSIKANYAGTQILQTQLEQGSEADFFLSANLGHMKKVKQEGLVKDFYPVSKNHEVIIVPKNNPGDIHSLADLAKSDGQLIIGVDNVPIGQYARKILTKASADFGPDFPTKVMSHVASLETNVKQILEKVALGNGDAGIVYRTDVTKEFSDKVTMIEIPPKYNVVATNYIAVTTHGHHPKLSSKLLNFLKSSQGQAVFQKYHYDPIK